MNIAQFYALSTRAEPMALQIAECQELANAFLSELGALNPGHTIQGESLSERNLGDSLSFSFDLKLVPRDVLALQCEGFLSANIVGPGQVYVSALLFPSLLGERVRGGQKKDYIRFSRETDGWLAPQWEEDAFDEFP